ncbi:MAG: hypothetical protein MUP52_02155 [Candidatus Aminicenantes bacterium]|nr:hypothetical protein [Candidatus Aminicenantes bacterium]
MDLLQRRYGPLYLPMYSQREIDPTIYSLGEYRAKKKEKQGFILELLKSPKMMLIGSENDL